MKKVLTLIVLAVLLVEPHNALAQVDTSTYRFIEYGFGTGGTEGINTTSYSILGTAGDEGQGTVDTSSYTIGGGQPSVLLANVPATPTFTNPSTNYDRLKIVIDNGSNPTDAQFLVAISTDNFTTTNYVQSDYTIGSGQNWLPYSGGGSWGGASGVFVTGLVNNTTYKIKVKARQGNFTESGFSAVATQTTSNPSLTFSVSSSTLTFNNLNAGNSFTDSSQTTSLTTATNAFNGYTIYGYETQALTSPVGTITNYAGTNTTPTTWTSTGFGYTTDDNNLGGGTAARFAAGTKYAGFTTSGPGDPVGDNTAAATSDLFTIGYRITANNVQKAGTYTNALVYTIVPVY